MSPQTAEMLPSCSGGPAYIGWGRECSHQSQDPVAEELPLPQCQTIAWHPNPRKKHTREMVQASLQSGFENPKAAKNLEGPPVPIAVSGQGFISAALSLDHGGHTSAHSPWLGSSFFSLTLVNVKAFATLSPGAPTNDTFFCCLEGGGRYRKGVEHGKIFFGCWREWKRNKR